MREGGGLLVVGGEQNVYVENKKAEDALQRTLPAKLLPPRNNEGVAVVLIIDKSSSMEGPKIDLAKAAATGTVANLRPMDQVGVLAFDNSFAWVVPLRKADDRNVSRRSHRRHLRQWRLADRARAYRGLLSHSSD